MDQLICAFKRVIRGLADAQKLIETANALADGSLDGTSLSQSDRLGILDFPDPEKQQENIATATLLSKADLLKRAVESPEDLTVLEINVLKQRYWLDVTDAEEDAHSRANSALRGAVSRESLNESTERLKLIRIPLYDVNEVNEEQAFFNAQMEEWDRGMRARKQQKQQEFESSLGRAQPWVKRLWQEDHAEKKWGFAVFVDLDLDEAEREEFECRQDAMLYWAKGAVGCGATLGSEFLMQHLDWPGWESESEGAGQGNGEGSKGSIGDADVDGAEGDGAEVDDTESDGTDSESVLSEFDLHLLRKEFRALRDNDSKEQHKTSSDGSTGRLKPGILRNTFLLITPASVDPVFSGHVDNMWLWAIDPDYEAPSTSAPGQGAIMEYKGYLKVRLQQLVNNFFDARRFHEDEYSMQDLWEAAQRSKNQAFVSLKDDEVGLWSLSRDVGSAIRPAGSKRIVTNLDDL